MSLVDMGWPHGIADGTNIRCIFLQLDIVESSQLSGPELAIQETKEVLRRFVKGALRVYAGYEMCWRGDGGVFLFPADTQFGGPWPWDNAVLGALQVLDTLELFNQRLNPLNKDLMLRISADEGVVIWSKDPSVMQEHGLDHFVKHERDLGEAEHVTLTPAVYENLRLRQVKQLFVPSCRKSGLYIHPDDRLLSEIEIQVEKRRQLGSFPDGFEPLLIVVGARRLRWGKTRPVRHDTGAPGSPRDLALLPLLRLPPHTVIAADADLSGRDDILGQYNLLSLGSPMVNLVSRRLNTVSPFKFYVPPRVRERLEGLETDPEFDRAMDIDWGTIRSYLKGGPRPGAKSLLLRLLEKRIEVEEVVGELAGSGFIDPLEECRHPRSPGEGLEGLGVVALCPNPWSRHRSAALVAGIQGSATHGAVAALAEVNGVLQGRPLGGVFRYSQERESPIPAERGGTLSWLTGPYDVNSLVGLLRQRSETGELDRLYGGRCEIVVNE